MCSPSKVLVTIWLLSITVPDKVSAIDCFQCQSNTDIECSEMFDEDFTKLKPMPCNHVFEAQYCIKSTGMFEGEIGTTRFCSSRDYGDYCDYVKRPGDERDYRSCIYTCSSDGCNHSSALYFSKIVNFSFILLAFVYLSLNF